MELEEDKQEEDKLGGPMVLRLNTLKNSRLSLARILRAYNADSMDGVKYRNLIYGFGTYLNVLKAETEMNIEERIGEVEKRLGIETTPLQVVKK